MFIFLKKILCLMLIFLFLLMGCSYTPKVIKPDDSGSKAEWLKYYKDQFKAYGGEVEAPSDEASDAQKTAYQQARASWRRGVIVSYIVSGVVLAISIGVLVTTISTASQL